MELHGVRILTETVRDVNSVVKGTLIYAEVRDNGFKISLISTMEKLILPT